MSSDFFAGYLSGAIGIVIGNPLDLVKVRLQAGQSVDISRRPGLSGLDNASSLVKGAAAPILGYGALNALLFVAYNRSLMLLDSSVTNPTAPDSVPLYKIWLAGAAGGLASWTVSSPTEFIKCRAQLDSRPEVSSWTIAKDIIRTGGFRGLYYGGVITSIRDLVGYGFYFWSYEYCKRLMTSEEEDTRQAAIKVLLCGGIAGIVTWASVFPLDVIKTRLQAQTIGDSSSSWLEGQSLLSASNQKTLGSLQLAKEAYRTEGLKVFYRGLGVCSLRAFMVNAVQVSTYYLISETDT